MSEPIAFVFPGQGSQVVGMGADVFQTSPAASDVFAIADRAVDISLSEICFAGPEESLRQTVNTQPALVTTSLALLAALQEAAGGGYLDLRTPLQPSYVAGHSVGEYAALATAGALSIADTVRLVRERGRLMQEAGLQCPSGMAAVLGLDAEPLTRICAEATERTRARLGPDSQAGCSGVGCVVVANDNAPGQIVISGDRVALDAAMELARAAGARRVVPLPVSGAFHSPVMAPATEGMVQAVAVAPLRDAAIPIIANRNGLPITGVDDLRTELAEQVESPVQWTRSVEFLLEQGVQTFVEIGAGQVLSGLIKRIAKGAPVATISVATAADIEPVARRLLGMLGSPGDIQQLPTTGPGKV